jgi:hypothetical protein
VILILISSIFAGCSNASKEVNTNNASEEVGTNNIRRLEPITEGREIFSINNISSITVPDDWTNDMQLNPQAIINISNQVKEKYAIVFTEPKEAFADDMTIKDYYEIIMNNIKTKMDISESTEPQEVMINNYPGLLYEIHGEVEKIKVGYLCAIVETDEYFHQIMTWTLESKFDEYKDEFTKIIGSLKELDESNRPQGKSNQSAEETKVIEALDGQSRITVPKGWNANYNLSEIAAIGASDNINQKFALVVTETKENFSSDITIDEYCNLVVEYMELSVSNSNITEKKKLTINGKQAVQFELWGEIDKIKIAYLITIIETEDNFHQVTLWTMQSRFNEFKEEFSKIAESFEEI